MLPKSLRPPAAVAVFFCRILMTVSAFALGLTARATIQTDLQAQLGNPSGATADATNHNHYLVSRPQYWLDFSDSLGNPNWVSWDLTTGDVGSAGRSNDFEPDTSLPAGFYQVTTADYNGVGNINFNRGHMSPSEDRTDNTTDNLAVFLMDNILPQSADNNQGPWEVFESYCRSLASAGNELLITSGGSLYDGTSRIPSGKAAIPAYTWKVVVVVPNGSGTAASRITPTTRVIAIKMNNVNGIRSNPWQNYIVSAGQIEADTGLTFFTSLPSSTATALRQEVDGQTTTGGPTISVQPTPQSAAVNGTATFAVTASDGGHPPLSYQWSKDDTAISAATNASLTISPVQASDAGNYSVAVTNSVSMIQSQAVALTVTGLPPSITTAPTSTTVSAGTLAAFSVTAGGSPTLSYQWRKGGVNLANGATGNGSTISGATSPNLSIANAQAGDAATTYDVVVTNSVSSVTSSPQVSLTVNPAAATVVTSPSSQTASPGTTATFTVVATGTNSGSNLITYQWRKNASPLSDGGVVSGSSTATLTLTAVSTADAGSYDVVVSNGLGSPATSAAATFTVSTSTATQVGYAGGTYTQNFDSLPNSGTFTFSGAGPFYFGDTSLSFSSATRAGMAGWSFAKVGGTGANALFNVGTGSGNTGSVYSFGSTGSTDRALGTLLSNATDCDIGVTIVNNTSQTITQFTVTYTGEQWRYGGSTESLDAGGNHDALLFGYQVGGSDIKTGTFTSVADLDLDTLIISGSVLDGNATGNHVIRTATVTGISWAPNQTLVLRWHDKDLTPGADDGLAVDDFSFTTPVTPAVAPTISAQPQPVTITAGATATFSVTASGSGSLTYQWRHNSTPISTTSNPSAATATLTINNAQSADAGSYDVIVSNGVNPAATSNAATLTVNAPDAYATFKTTYGLDATTGAPDADPDNDGIANMLEFALGGNPTLSDRSILPTTTYTTVAGQPALVYSYNLKTAASSVVTVTVESSTDLATWTPVVDGQNGATIVTTSVDANTNHVTVTIPTSGTRLFAHLHLVY